MIPGNRYDCEPHRGRSTRRRLSRRGRQRRNRATPRFCGHLRSDTAEKPYQRGKTWDAASRDDQLGAADHRTELLHPCIPDRQLSIDDVIDCTLILGGPKIQLLLRPLGPRRVVCDEVQKDIRINEDQPSSSPRLRAITSSVVIPSLALPRRRANLLSGARCSVRRRTRPSPASCHLIVIPNVVEVIRGTGPMIVSQPLNSAVGRRD